MKKFLVLLLIMFSLNSCIGKSGEEQKDTQKDSGKYAIKLEDGMSLYIDGKKQVSYDGLIEDFRVSEDEKNYGYRASESIENGDFKSFIVINGEKKNEFLYEVSKNKGHMISALRFNQDISNYLYLIVNENSKYELYKNNEKIKVFGVPHDTTYSNSSASLYTDKNLDTYVVQYNSDIFINNREYKNVNVLTLEEKDGSLLYDFTYFDIKTKSTMRVTNSGEEFITKGLISGEIFTSKQSNKIGFLLESDSKKVKFMIDIGNGSKQEFGPYDFIKNIKVYKDFKYFSFFARKGDNIYVVTHNGEKKVDFNFHNLEYPIENIFFSKNFESIYIVAKEDFFIESLYKDFKFLTFVDFDDGFMATNKPIIDEKGNYAMLGYEQKDRFSDTYLIINDKKLGKNIKDWSVSEDFRTSVYVSEDNDKNILFMNNTEIYTGYQEITLFDFFISNEVTKKFLFQKKQKVFLPYILDKTILVIGDMKIPIKEGDQNGFGHSYNNNQISVYARGVSIHYELSKEKVASNISVNFMDQSGVEKVAHIKNGKVEVSNFKE